MTGTDMLGRVLSGSSAPKMLFCVARRYTWVHSGITSYSGNVRVQNRPDRGVSLGATVYFNSNNLIRI